MFARSPLSVTSKSTLLVLAALAMGACSTTTGAGTGGTVDAGCFPNCKPDVKVGDGAGGDATSGTDDDTSGTDEQDTGGGGGTDGPPANFEGYHAQELNIRIVGPSGRGHAVVSGSVVEVAGVVFGKADTITWTTVNGDSGSAHGAPFFQLRMT